MARSVGKENESGREGRREGEFRELKIKVTHSSRVSPPPPDDDPNRTGLDENRSSRGV